MIFLYIILVLLFVLLLVLLSDISLIFSYKDKFIFKVRFLCVSLSGSKLIEIIQSREKPDSSETVKSKIEPPKEKRKKTFSDIIEIVSFIASLIKSILGEFLKYAKLKLCKVKISIGTDDCAETALAYGGASSALYTVLEFLDSMMTVKKSYKNIGVIPDYTSDECKVDIKIVLKIKILHLLFAFIHISPQLAKAQKGK